MTFVNVRIHSTEGIETEIEGLGTGKLTAERQPKIGVRGGMGFGGGEILCFAAGTCFYNNLRREANNRNIELDVIAIEISAEWDDASPVAHEIVIKPYVESKVDHEEIEALIRYALEISSVANTISHGVPVRLSNK
jgi:uncharacterized OsmC-like protein